MKVTAKIKLDLRSQNYGSSVYAVQGDGGSRCVEAALLDGGKPWDVPAGVTAAVAYKKPDFTKGLYDKLADDTPAVTVSGSTVTVVLAKQMLTVPGSVQACIVFNNVALDQLTTFPFTVAVAANPVIGAEPSDDYIRLQWLEDKLDEYVKKITEGIVPGGSGGAVSSVNGKTGAVVLTADDVHALPDNTVIPTVPEKVSAFENDAGYLTEHQDISGKVDKVAGKGLSTHDYDDAAKAKVDAIPEDPKYTDTVYDDTAVVESLNQLKDDIAGLAAAKQDKLIAGTGITIAEDGKTISAVGGVGSCSSNGTLIAHKVWSDCYIELTPVGIDYENYTITVADASGVPLEISGNCTDHISITDWSGKNATFDIAPVELFPVQFFAIHVGDNRLQFYNSQKTLIQFTANDNVDINRFKIYVKKQNATGLSVTNLYQNHAYRIVMVKRGFNHFVSGFSIKNSNNGDWSHSYGNHGGVKSLGLGSNNAGNSFLATQVNGYETFSLRGVHYSDIVTCSFFPSIIDVEIVPSKNGNVFEHWLHWRMSYVQRGSSTVKEITYRYTTGTLFMPYEIGSISADAGNAGMYFGNGTEILVFDKGEWVE